VRVVPRNTALIKSAFAFLRALRPTAASSISARVAKHLSYGLRDFFFVFFVTRAHVLYLALCAVFKRRFSRLCRFRQRSR
jgi:hypothetical protein